MARKSVDSLTPLTSLADLTLDDRSANVGTTRGRSALTDSLTDCGAGRSIVADKHGRVVAGNKVVAAARALNLPITVVRTAGE